MIKYRMKYIDWYKEHLLKHQVIIEQIKDEGINEIIDYFEYENMQSLHKDFCPLFEQGIKCHNIKKLNCYLCGCPYFRFDDNGLHVDENKNIVYSYCIKDLGDKFIANGKTHHDCSKCTLPHTKKFINDNFDIDWSMIMKDVMRP